MSRIEPDPWLAARLGVPAHRIRLDGLPAVVPGWPEGFLWTRVPVDALDTVAWLSGQGFRLVDTTVTLVRTALPMTPAEDAVLRRACPLDKERVGAIAYDAFQHGRFFADPVIGPATARRIKRDWAESFFAGARGTDMIVAERAGKAAGFLLVIAGSDAAIIDLIAVDESHRGHGLARAMVAEALRLLPDCPLWRVGTQLANIASLRLYAGIGFVPESAAYVLHRHADGTDA